MSNYSIRRAGKNDLPGMQRLWQRCFGDPQEYVTRFFSALYGAGEGRVAERDGKLAAMALGLDLMELETAEGERLPCRYLYAVCTAPEARDQGLGSRVSQAVEANIVLPADPGLYAYYTRLGFQNFFYVQERRFSPQELAPAAGEICCPCTSAQYGRLREAQLKGRTHLVFKQQALEYQGALGPLFSLFGGCAAVEAAGRDGVLVKELLVPREARQAAIQAIAGKFPGKSLLVRVPAEAGADSRPFGQLLANTVEGLHLKMGDVPYFGLAFD